MDYEPLHVTFDGKPHAIVSQLDDVPRQVAGLVRERGQRKWLVRLLFIWGTVLVIADLLVGYPSHVFVFAGIGAYIAGIVAAIASMSLATPGKVPEGCAAVRAIVHTLRDDIHPERGMFGHLDFTGWEKPQKRALERTNAAGAKVNIYRDEWLAIKTKLRDGTGFRLAAVRCVKRRAGFWKRGSRKSKWKSATTKADYQELKIRFVSSVPAEQAVTGGKPNLMLGRRIGSYKIEECTIKSGIVDVSASSAAREPTSGDILEVLRFAHGLLPGRRA